MGVMSPITGRLFDKFGARWLTVIGFGIIIVTTFQFTQLTTETSYAFLIIVYAFRMLGMALLMMPVMTAGLNQLPQRLNPHGSAMANTMQQVSGSIGTALLITIMTNQTGSYLKDKLASTGVHLPKGAEEFTRSSSQAALAKLPPETQHQMMAMVKNATVHGINDAFVVAIGVAVLGLLLSFFIKRTKPAEEEDYQTDEQKTYKTRERTEP